LQIVGRRGRKDENGIPGRVYDGRSDWIECVVGDCVSAMDAVMSKQIHFEIDDELAARWKKVSEGMKKGMQSKLFRGTLLLVIRQLESGRQLRVSEVVQLELRKEEELGEKKCYMGNQSVL
jgi:hypothetical protein